MDIAFENALSTLLCKQAQEGILVLWCDISRCVGASITCAGAAKLEPSLRCRHFIFYCYCTPSQFLCQHKKSIFWTCNLLAKLSILTTAPQQDTIDSEKHFNSREGYTLAWSYNRLWIQLIQKGLKKTDLKHMAGINSTTLAKMGKNQEVTMGALGKICAALNCSVEEIIEYIPD